MNWSYVAGFFDGEGWLTISREGNERKVKLGLGQNAGAGLIEISDFVNAKLRLFRTGYSDERKCHTLYWCNAHDVEAICLGMLPYLIVKRRHVEECLKELKTFRKCKRPIHLRQLNADEVHGLYVVRLWAAQEVAGRLGCSKKKVLDFLRARGWVRSSSESKRLQGRPEGVWL